MRTSLRLSSLLLCLASLAITGCGTDFARTHRRFPGGAQPGGNHHKDPFPSKTIKLPDYRIGHGNDAPTLISNANISLLGHDAVLHRPELVVLQATVTNNTDKPIVGLQFDVLVTPSSLSDSPGSETVRSLSAITLYPGDAHVLDQQRLPLLVHHIDVESPQFFSLGNLQLRHPVHYEFELSSPRQSRALFYSDDALSILLVPERRGVGFILHNDGQEAIRLHWEEAALVDCQGRSLRVTHSGVSALNRYAAQPPTSIPAGAAIADIFVPADNIIFNEAASRWDTLEFLPTTTSGTDLTGRAFSAFVPVSIGPARRDYTFAIRISKMTLASRDRPQFQ